MSGDGGLADIGLKLPKTPHQAPTDPVLASGAGVVDLLMSYSKD